jgi:hypothetical protein
MSDQEDFVEIISERAEKSVTLEPPSPEKPETPDEVVAEMKATEAETQAKMDKFTSTGEDTQEVEEPETVTLRCGGVERIEADRWLLKGHSKYWRKKLTDDPMRTEYPGEYRGDIVRWVISYFEHTNSSEYASLGQPKRILVRKLAQEWRCDRLLKHCDQFYEEMDIKTWRKTIERDELKELSKDQLINIIWKLAREGEEIKNSKTKTVTKVVERVVNEPVVKLVMSYPSEDYFGNAYFSRRLGSSYQYQLTY